MPALQSPVQSLEDCPAKVAGPIHLADGSVGTDELVEGVGINKKASPPARYRDI